MMPGESNENRIQPASEVAALDLSHLFEVTALNFPHPILLTRTGVGDILQLKLHTIGNKSGILVLYQGQIAGFISMPGDNGLLESMRNGSGFEAVVQEIYGGNCRVQIRLVADAGA